MIKSFPVSDWFMIGATLAGLAGGLHLQGAGPRPTPSLHSIAPQQSTPVLSWDAAAWAAERANANISHGRPSHQVKFVACPWPVAAKQGCKVSTDPFSACSDPLWFQKPPFQQRALLFQWYQEPAFQWSVSNEGNYTERCGEDDPNYPCCIGMTHNGGSHDFQGYPGGSCNHVNNLQFNGQLLTVRGQNGHRLFQALGGRKMLVIGDSVVHQQFLGIECALRQKGCSSARLKSFPTPASYCENMWRSGIKWREEVRITCGSTVTTLVFLRQYQPCVQNSKWLEEELVEQEKPDIILLAILGAHFEFSSPYDDLSPNEARKKLTAVVDSTVMQKYMASSEVTVIVSEHLPPDRATWGGDYFAERFEQPQQVKFGLTEKLFGNLGGSYGCFPNVYLPGQHAWREKLTRSVLEERKQEIWLVNESANAWYAKKCSRVRNVAWLPLHDLGQSRPDHFPIQNMKGTLQCEGTHICYTPNFWEPMVFDLARIVESC